MVLMSSFYQISSPSNLHNYQFLLSLIIVFPICTNKNIEVRIFCDIFLDIEFWIEKGYVKVLFYNKSIIVKLKKPIFFHLQGLDDDEI